MTIGLCYASKEFKELMEHFQVQCVTNSPHFPQSNGFAEAMMKNSEETHGLLHSTRETMELCSHEYKCTPLTSNIPSPLELLTGQKPRTGLPSIP